MSKKLPAQSAAPPKMTREQIQSEMRFCSRIMGNIMKQARKMGIERFEDLEGLRHQVYMQNLNRRNELYQMLITDHDRAYMLSRMILDKFHNFDYHEALEEATHYGLELLEPEEGVTLELIRGPRNSPPQQFLIYCLKMQLKRTVITETFVDVPEGVINEFDFEEMLYNNIDWEELLFSMDSSDEDGFLTERPIMFRGEQVFFDRGGPEYEYYYDYSDYRPKFLKEFLKKI